MKKKFGPMLLILLMATLVACGDSEYMGAEVVDDGGEGMTTPDAGETMTEESYPDPDAEVAQEVVDYVRGWVSDQAGEGGVYNIPPRGGQDVSGEIGDFHTVHQSDADTYSVCVDFNDGDNLYDVDFFVDRGADGLIVADHYLHKVNGEAVPE